MNSALDPQWHILKCIVSPSARLIDLFIRLRFMEVRIYNPEDESEESVFFLVPGERHKTSRSEQVMTESDDLSFNKSSHTRLLTNVLFLITHNLC